MWSYVTHLIQATTCCHIRRCFNKSGSIQHYSYSIPLYKGYRHHMKSKSAYHSSIKCARWINASPYHCQTTDSSMELLITNYMLLIIVVVVFQIRIYIFILWILIQNMIRDIFRTCLRAMSKLSIGVGNLKCILKMWRAHSLLDTCPSVSRVDITRVRHGPPS